MVEGQHAYHKLPLWSAVRNQLLCICIPEPLLSRYSSVCSCLEHVVNFVNIDIMSHITKIAVIKTTNAIWEYNLTDPNNHVLNSKLDVIVVIRMLMIKVQLSILPCYHY